MLEVLTFSAIRFDFLRASLMTLVSTKYMIDFYIVIDSLEILIKPHVGHGDERFREGLALWPQQYSFEQGAVLSLCTSSVPYRTLLERIDDALIEISDHQVCHNFTTSVAIYNRYQ
jgi:hypothetical protein